MSDDEIILGETDKVEWVPINIEQLKKLETELAELRERCEEYQKTLELIADKSPRCDCMDTPCIAKDILAKYKGDKK